MSNHREKLDELATAFEAASAKLDEAVGLARAAMKDLSRFDNGDVRTMLGRAWHPQQSRLTKMAAVARAGAYDHLNQLQSEAEHLARVAEGMRER